MEPIGRADRQRWRLIIVSLNYEEEWLSSGCCQLFVGSALSTTIWGKSSGQTIECLNTQQASSQPQPQPPTLIPLTHSSQLKPFEFSRDKIRLGWWGECLHVRVLVAVTVWLHSAQTVMTGVQLVVCGMLGGGVRLVESAWQEWYKQVRGNWLCVSKATAGGWSSIQKHRCTFLFTHTEKNTARHNEYKLSKSEKTKD